MRLQERPTGGENLHHRPFRTRPTVLASYMLECWDSHLASDALGGGGTPPHLTSWLSIGEEVRKKYAEDTKGARTARGEHHKTTQIPC